MAIHAEVTSRARTNIFERSSPSNLAEFALIAGIAFAALAFGGTEPGSFAVVEVLFAAAAVLVVQQSWGNCQFSWHILLPPALLVALVALQMCPLPISWRVTDAENLSNSGSTWATLTIDPFATRVHSLVLVTCVIGFFLAQTVCKTRSGKWHLLMGIVGLGVFEAFYGLVQYLTGWQRIFSYVKKYDLEEATGTYINRNHYAGLLEMLFPFTIALTLRELWKLQKRKGAMPKLKTLLIESRLQNLLLWLSISLVTFAAIIFSRSRMGIAAAGISLVLVFGLAAGSRFRSRTAFVFALTFVLLSMSLMLWIGLGSVLERFQTVNQEYGSDYSRMSIWQDTLKLIGQHPWFGTGFGTFPVAFTTVQTSFLGQFVNHAHNDYLEFASDLGIPAALALIAGFVWIFIRAVRATRVAKDSLERFLAVGCAGSILAILLHSLADFNLYIPANCLLFASVLGLTMCLQGIDGAGLTQSR